MSGSFVYTNDDPNRSRSAKIQLEGGGVIVINDTKGYRRDTMLRYCLEPQRNTTPLPVEINGLIEMNGYYNKINECGISDMNPTIRCNSRIGADHVAREIRRRVLDPYSEALALFHQRVEEYEVAQAAFTECVRKVAEQMSNAREVKDDRYFYKDGKGYERKFDDEVVAMFCQEIQVGRVIQCLEDLVTG